MMEIRNKLKYVLTSLLVTLCNVFMFADFEDSDVSGDPSETEGALASPIDMYVVLLGIVAVVFILYYVRKYQQSKKIA